MRIQRRKSTFFTAVMIIVMDMTGIFVASLGKESVGSIIVTPLRVSLYGGLKYFCVSFYSGESLSSDLNCGCSLSK
jgi:hypothetical protein